MKWNIIVYDDVSPSKIYKKFILGSVELTKHENYHQIKFDSKNSEMVDDTYFFISRCLFLEKTVNDNVELLFWEEGCLYSAVAVDNCYWEYPTTQNLKEIYESLMNSSSGVVRLFLPPSNLTEFIQNMFLCFYPANLEIDSSEAQEFIQKCEIKALAC